LVKLVECQHLAAEGSLVFVLDHPDELVLAMRRPSHFILLWSVNQRRDLELELDLVVIARWQSTELEVVVAQAHFAATSPPIPVLDLA